MPNSNSSGGQMMMIAAVLVCFCLFLSSVATGGLLYTATKSSSSSFNSIITTSSSSKSSGTPSSGTPSIPFKKGSIQATPESTGNNQLIYLDRHNVNCGTKAINQFQYQRDGTSNFHYNFTCSDGGNLGPSAPTAGSTPSGPYYGDQLYMYLDRHNISCPVNNVLSQFQFTRPDANSMKYNYSCKPSDKPLTCREVITPPDDYGIGPMHLEKHNVSCEADEAMSQFQFIRPSPDKIQYKYKCCK